MAAMERDRGAGTSMLTRRLTTSLPAMTLAEAIATTRIRRVAGLTSARTAGGYDPAVSRPHHTISAVGLIGGGTCRRRARCLSCTTVCSSWMNCRSSAATS